MHGPRTLKTNPLCVIHVLGSMRITPPRNIPHNPTLISIASLGYSCNLTYNMPSYSIESDGTASMVTGAQNANFQ